MTTRGDAFRFRTSPRAPWRVTHEFEHATVKGRTSKPPIDKQGRVTVRLQGIDAPELHYRPPALVKSAEQTNGQHELYLEWNEDYRQPLAESATLALRVLLEQASEDPLPCVVRSYVDQPNDVFDNRSERYSRALPRHLCLGRRRWHKREAAHGRNSAVDCSVTGQTAKVFFQQRLRMDQFNATSV